jgi:DtxR family Mn-dependent transcriptional regulator
VTLDAPATVSPILQQCVDAAGRLGRERGTVTVATLARRLDVGRDVATERLLALSALGLATTDAAGRVTLTVAGERLARSLLRKHRLLERFFTDLLGLPWEQVHDEAARMTPAVSDAVADGLAKLLGHPTSCPHGNAIPALEGDFREETAVPLSQLGVHRPGTIVRIEREEPELLKYLLTLGLLPDIAIEVEELAPLGGPVLVRVGSARYALGRKIAAHIFVRPEA